MRLFTILVASLLATPLFAADSDWIEFDHRNGRIAFEITLDGREVMAVIDARAAANGVARALDWAPSGDDVDIELAGQAVKVDKVMPMPLTSADFLIGKPFFRDYLVQIDYPNGRIRMLDRDSVNIKKSANVKMKNISGSNFPVVQVDINGEDKQWLVFDPGTTNGLVLSRDSAEKKGWLDRFEEAELNDEAAYGHGDAFVTPALTIGPHTMEGVVASVPSDGADRPERLLQGGRNTGSRLDGKRTKKADGKLGYDVLSNFIVTIDYRKSLLQFAKPDSES